MRRCIMCNGLIEDEEFFVDESLNTYWCFPCGDEELEKRNKNEN